ncbi:MAG: hypothetical protein M3Q14_02760 [bacterium]|nr:hypothetical protein [bacterium]
MTDERYPQEYPDTMKPLSWAISELLESMDEEGVLPAPDAQRAREVALRDNTSEVTFMEQRARELQEQLDQDPENEDSWKELDQLQKDYAKALIDRSKIPPA